MSATARQAGAVRALLEQIFGAGFVGLYLYGSAVAGRLRPASDLDLLAVVTRSATTSQRQRLVADLTPFSARDARPEGWRPLELTVVVSADINPLRQPPRTDFQLGEWMRTEIEEGTFDPGPTSNPDLVIVLAQVRGQSTTLVGPLASQLIAPIAKGELRDAMVDALPDLMADLDGDEANVLLTLARILFTLETGAFTSKDEAADWALDRIGAEHQPALTAARDTYTTGNYDEWPVSKAATLDAAAALECEVRRAAA
jgi:streptomycin 3"-adenylyltransferase